MLGTLNDMRVIRNDKLLSAYSDRAIKLWDLHTGKLLFSVGRGELNDQITRVFFLVIILTLMLGFLGISIDPDNQYSSIAIIAILSVWTFGILIPFYYLRSSFTKYSTAISWITTILSAFFLITIFGAFWALYILPFGLFCGYQQIKYGEEKSKIAISVILNLVFCLFLCYLKYFKEILPF